MKNISGYARVLARIMVNQQLNKSFLGKPYIKYGQCYWMWGYFFQLGGILGAKHSTNLDSFGPAFLGMKGPSGAVKNFFTEVAKRIMSDFVRDSISFFDYVSLDATKRSGYSGDSNMLFFERGRTKMPPDVVEQVAWQYSGEGAALGTIHPHVIRNMFEYTYATVPKEKWEGARAAGLNIPQKQEKMVYEETEKEENEAFMYYCQEDCPNLYSILSK